MAKNVFIPLLWPLFLSPDILAQDCLGPVNVTVWPEEAVEGASAIMRCSYIIDKDCFFLLVWRRGDGNPDKSYIAHHRVNDSDPQDPSKGKYYMAIDIQEGSNLTVKNVSKKDSGEYRCELKMCDTEFNIGSANLTVLGASTTIIPSPTATTTSTTEGGLSGGAIAGIVIGVIALLAIILIPLICKFRR
ncbi:uncharacterized protein LOC110988929 isoform X2 [Acanthaster planci]|uniref:Uncharacterized protein LOC110988929 isoform X2 n=1 Tax=Acanthaster planci TaxID=133434 RepID=A0A8B7ZUZ8_ACAPL|nr:uncharacterized protein LOC110988929 isoform X2 [Acanthaster planci]